MRNLSITTLILTLGLLSVCERITAQVITFQESLLFNQHHTGYSILNFPDPVNGADRYLLAGTLVQPSLMDSTDIHLLLMNDTGSVIWENTYSTGENERCLGIGHANNGFIIAGVADTGSSHGQMFLLQVDATGGVIGEMRYESPFAGHTHGLCVQQTQDNGYIVVGFIAIGYELSDPKRSFVLKVDSLLNPVWSRYFDTPWDINRDFDMAENVIEIPNLGYFVSGSVNLKKYMFGSPVPNTTDQGVLAIMLDLNGNLLWNSSFTAQDSTYAGHMNVGVKAYFDASANLIYLMANNTEIHGFDITVFDLSGNIVNHWEYAYQLNGLAGFDLLESGNPNTLVACALATFYDFQVGDLWYASNYPPILMEFNKTNGSMVWGEMYLVPSEGYGNFPNGFFTPFYGQQPQLFTPDMAVRSSDGGYAVASYRSNASIFYDLELIKTGPTGWVDCPHYPMNFIPTVGSRFPMDSITVDSGFTAAPIQFFNGAVPNGTIYCSLPDTCVCHVDAGFTISTTDSCTWQFTDHSTVDSCYQICSRFWDFGDGNISYALNPSHSYDSSGVYTVCLNTMVCSVTGEILCESIFCDTVVVSCAPCGCEIDAGISFNTLDGCTFMFNDVSVVDSCYEICSWTWTFGDGTSSALQHPTHTYSASSFGLQNVCLQVVACDSLMNPVCDTTVCQQVFVECDTCVCDIMNGFTYTSDDSCTFQFVDQSTVDSCFSICSWMWDFGDGNQSTAQNPSHTYATSGWYTVCLQVSSCGITGMIECDTVFCQDVYVQCSSCECQIDPDFSFSINYDSCTVRFNDMSHMADTCHNIWAWYWDFGDGTSSSNQNPTHSYPGSGIYTVCQTVYAGTPGNVACEATYCREVYINCDTCICRVEPAFDYVINEETCEVCFENRTVLGPCTDLVALSWDLYADGSVQHEEAPCAHYSVNGAHRVCITISTIADGVPCDSTYCEDINIHCCDTINSVWNPVPPVNAIVYPNPINDQATIQLSRKLDNGKVVLYDLYGRKVDVLHLNGSIGVLNKNQLAQGLYQLVIMEGDLVIFEGKLVIQ